MKRFRWIWGFLLGIGLVGGLAAPAPGVGESPTGESLVQLRDVSVEPRTNGLAIQIKTSGPATYETSLIDTPTRLVIDLESTGYGWRKSPMNVGMDPLRTIRGSQLKKGVSRVVLELTRKVGYRIDEGPEGLTVMLEPSATSAAPAARAERVPESGSAEAKPGTPAAVPAPKAEPSTPAAPALVAKAEPPAPAPEPEKERPAPAAEPAKAAPTGKTPRRVVVAVVPPAALAAAAPPPISVAQAPAGQPPQAQAPAAPSNGSRLISLDFKDADIVNLLRILAAESSRNIVAGDDVKGKVSISLQNVPWQLALDTILEARGLEKIEKDGVLRIVSTEQLTKEREAKAKAAEAKVKGEAEARAKLAEAEVKEADAKQRKLAADAAIAEAQARGPLREETIRLRYADPKEVEETLRGILGIPPTGAAAGGLPISQPGVTPSIGIGGAPLIAQPPFAQLYGAQPTAGAPAPVVSASADVLAKGITIKANPATNSIFIRTYAADLERIKKLINESLDVPPPQIKIEARMEELNRTSLKEIGVQWSGAGAGLSGRNILVGRGFERTNTAPTAPLLQPSGNTPGASIFAPPGIAQGPGRLQAGTVNPFAPLTSLLPIDPGTGLPTGGNLVNLPFTGGSTGLPPAGAISFGIIGTRFNLNLAIEALETMQKTKTLAHPEIVTVENKPAQISLGEEIPYATVSSAGTQVQFKEAVLSLTVTPTVVREPDGNKIKMKVVVENNSRGFTATSGPAAGIPAINKRRAETEVIVKEGEILVIGGVGQNTTFETISKVPWLGDIPVLGWLFKRRTTEVNPDRELVIFITPSLIKGGAPAQTAPTAEKPEKYEKPEKPKGS